MLAITRGDEAAKVRLEVFHLACCLWADILPCSSWPIPMYPMPLFITSSGDRMEEGILMHACGARDDGKIESNNATAAQRLFESTPDRDPEFGDRPIGIPNLAIARSGSRFWRSSRSGAIGIPIIAIVRSDSIAPDRDSDFGDQPDFGDKGRASESPGRFKKTAEKAQLRAFAKCPRCVIANSVSSHVSNSTHLS